MSIRLMNMRLYMKIIDGHHFWMHKVSGRPLSVVASNGHDMDMDIRELWYREHKELLI